MSTYNKLVAKKIFKLNNDFPSFVLISPRLVYQYCTKELKVTKYRVRKCIVYDGVNPGYPAIAYRKICTESLTVYLYGEHVTNAGLLVDESNRIVLPLFKSTEETYF